MDWVQEFSIRTFFLCDHYLHLLEVSNSSSEPVEIYVNIASPIKLEGNLLRYIDYELDIVWDLKNKLDPVIVDQIEFEEAKLKYNYCKELIDTCTRTSQSALSLVNNSLVKTGFFRKTLARHCSGWAISWPPLKATLADQPLCYSQYTQGAAG